jgi:lipopolysaccharide biosynthesis glycosyltransferase
MNSSSTADRVVIAAAADRNYVMPLGVMLRSVADRMRPGVTLVAYVADDGLTAVDRDEVAASLPQHVDLRWISRAQDELRELPNWGRMSLTTYHKLTLGEWLPSEVRRVLWLDVDLLVLADIFPLWESNLGDDIALAAQDAVVPYVSSRFGVAAHRELGLPAEQKYFNAGVLLIDLDRWRGAQVMNRAFDYLRRFGRRVFFWDQEALNAVLAGEWGELDQRWNWNATVDSLTNSQVDPFIVHFTGNLKPWLYCGSNRYQKRYEEVVDLTRWRGRRPRPSWRTYLLGKYESSRLRRRIYPLEQYYLRLVRLATRR